MIALTIRTCTDRREYRRSVQVFNRAFVTERETCRPADSNERAKIPFACFLF